MQTKFPFYVVPVHSNNEYSDEPTHCACEVRPSVALLIAWYIVLSRLLMRIASRCSEVRFYFPNINWMTLIENDHLLDEEIVEKGGFADADKIALSFTIDEDGFRGNEIQLFSQGFFRLLCYDKHSETEYYSDEIRVGELLRGLRFNHLLAEIGERV